MEGGPNQNKQNADYDKNKSNYYISDHESGQEGDFEDKSCYSEY